MHFPSLVVFDMAGTTVEDRGQVPAAFAEAMADAGIPVSPDQITRVRGASKREAIRQLLPPYQESRADEIYLRFRDKLAARYQAEGVVSIADAAGIFRRLKDQGVKIALTTGFDRDITMLLLSSLGWTRTVVDAVVCGDDVANGRPAPDMILMAMKLTGVSDAAQVANVGDTALDLEAASRAGVKWNIGVLSGAHARETLERAPHTQIIGSIADLRF
jgi:phosphonatase-like hydrolase